MGLRLVAWERYFAENGARLAAPRNLWKIIRRDAKTLGSMVDAIQLPGDGKTQSGNRPTGEGYGVTDRRDLGTKPQFGSTETFWGGLQDEMAAIAACHANGMKVFRDIIAHGDYGTVNGATKLLGADGKTFNGRPRTGYGWYKGHTNPIKNSAGQIVGWNDPIPPFRPGDPCPSPKDDNTFGALERVYKQSSPELSSLVDLTDYAVWGAKRTGTPHGRLDDPKGIWPEALAQYMAALHDGEFIGEYFDNRFLSLQWAMGAPIYGRAAVYDMDCHWRMQSAFNNNDLRLLTQGGAGGWEMNSSQFVVIVDSPDTDASRAADGGVSQQIVSNKASAHAYALCLPCRYADIYAKDFFPASAEYPQAYGLSSIANVAWFSRMFAIGAFAWRWRDDPDVIAYTRDGNGGAIWSGGALVAINVNPWVSRTITVQTMWQEGDWIHDYSGHCQDARVEYGGKLTVTLPKNSGMRGMAYGLFSKGGVDKPNPITPRRTKQSWICEFDANGKPDIDVMPIIDGMNVMPQEIYCAKDAVTLHLAMNRHGMAKDAYAQVELVDENDQREGWATTGDEATATAACRLKKPGWKKVRVVGNLMPPGGATFELSADYMGMEGI